MGKIRETWEAARGWMGRSSIPSRPAPSLQAPQPDLPARQGSDDQDIWRTVAAMAADILGSRVASPTQDRYNNWNRLCLSNESRELYIAYLKIRELFSDTTLSAANRRLTRGAVSDGFDHEFSPAFNTPESKSAAEWANALTEPAAEMLIGSGWSGGCVDYEIGPDRPTTIADVSEELGKYCNFPLLLSFYKSGGLKSLTPLPPFAWTINSDSNFRWFDKEKAYLQHDTATGRVVENGEIPARNMVWLSANQEPSQRYGFPFAYHASTFVDAFRSLAEGMEEARINGSPFPVFLTPGKEGLGMNVDELVKLKNSFPAAMQSRGERPSPFSLWRILNGVADAKVLSSSTGFFTEFGDAALCKSHIAMIYGLSIAIVEGLGTINRATMALLLRMESAMQRLWASRLALTGVYPTFRRVLDSAGIDKSLVKCELTWREARPPEEMVIESTVAMQAEQQGYISFEGAQSKVCSFLGLDPKIEQERGAIPNNAEDRRTGTEPVDAMPAANGNGTGRRPALPPTPGQMLPAGSFSTLPPDITESIAEAVIEKMREQRLN
jgi:hypothetical protein